LQAKRLVIAIDGPAASGKSTTARKVAEELGYLYVDTGAMYRAVTLEVLRRGIDPADEAAVGDVVRSIAVSLKPGKDGLGVSLNGNDVTRDIRMPEVTRNVSAVSRVRAVRDYLVGLQRKLGEQGGVVLEGRDIGTVVFPGADLKIFMVADLNARSQRRAMELRAQGVDVEEEALAEEIQNRDLLDSTRVESPLIRAGEAVEVDTSGLTIDQQVEFVVKKAKELLEKSQGR
jgi:cytidylate kinase